MGKVAVVTGVTGQDGSLLSKYLLDKEYIVVGVDRRTSSKTDWRLKDLNVLSNKNFFLASGDLTDSGSINRIVSKYQPQEFYNLGAMSFVKESWNTPNTTIQINTIGCVNCLEAIRNHAPECRFYQASTSEMLGGAKRTETFDENSPFYPRSPYGVSKLAAHWATINYRESYDIFACCGILFNHESEYRSLEFVTRKITDAVARIKLGLQTHVELGDLSPCRDWGYAGDFVRGMWLMLQQDKPDDFILATGKSRSIRQFLISALREVEIKDRGHRHYVKQNPAFMRPAEVGHLLGNAQKAKEVLGWKPEVSFDEMVAKMVNKDIERVNLEILIGSNSHNDT